MNIFFWVIDAIIPTTFILLFPIISKFSINIGINNYVGFRTTKSMLDSNNWEKANLLFGKYSSYLGILSILITLIVKIVKPFSIKINSLLLAFLNIISMLLLIILVNKKL